MAENFVFLLFLCLPVIFFFAARHVIRCARQTGNPRSKAALVGGNVLVLLMLLSTAVLGGEIYFRFFYDNTDSFALCKTTEQWFERHYKRNRTGFRDSFNYLPMTEPGKRRISFVGDSFTAGHGIKNVEDRFANRIRVMRPGYEIHVLAECGLDTGKELELVQFLPQSGYQTDIVVLAYCLNDISDITPEWDAILDRIYKGPQPGFFARNSYFFNTIHGRRQMARTPEVSNYYGFIEDAYRGEIWQTQQERLRAFDEAVTASGGRLLVITFPFLHALGDDYPYRDVHLRLDNFWAKQGVPHLDLLSIYKDMPPDQLIVNTRDVHPNEHAHQMAAEAIAPFIDDHLDDKRADDHAARSQRNRPL